MLSGPDRAAAVGRGSGKGHRERRRVAWNLLFLDGAGSVAASGHDFISLLLLAGLGAVARRAAITDWAGPPARRSAKAELESTTMELKDFVSQTITSIIEGVREAQASAQDGAYVNPVMAARPIEFDVAVTVTETTEKKGGGGIAVAGFIKAEGGGLTSSANSSVSRIKFHVPVTLPTQPGAPAAGRMPGHRRSRNVLGRLG